MKTKEIFKEINDSDKKEYMRIIDQLITIELEDFKIGVENGLVKELPDNEMFFVIIDSIVNNVFDIEFDEFIQDFRFDLLDDEAKNLLVDLYKELNK